MRVGLHSGPTIEAEGDHWGTTVVVARRLCDRRPGARDPQRATALVGARERRPAGSCATSAGCRSRAWRTRSSVCAMQWDGAPRRARRARRAAARSCCPRPCVATAGFVGRARELARLEDLVARSPPPASGGSRSSPASRGSARRACSRSSGDASTRAARSCSTDAVTRASPRRFSPIAEAPAPARGRDPSSAPAHAARRLGAGPRAAAAARSPAVGRAALELRCRRPTSTSCSRRCRSCWRATARATPVLLGGRGPALGRRGNDRAVAPRRLGVAAAPRLPSWRRCATRSSQPAIRSSRRPGEPIERLSLSGLDETEIGALLEADGDARPPRRSRRRCTRETAGNPLHAAELARAWSQSGSIVVRDRALVLAGGRAGGGRSVRRAQRHRAARRAGCPPTPAAC